MSLKKVLLGGFAIILIAAAAVAAGQNIQTAAARGPAGSATQAAPVGAGSETAPGYQGGQTTEQAASAAQGYQGGSSVGQAQNGAGASANPAPNQAQAGTGLELPAPSDLSAAEADALLFMYEEEKLARDVYTALFALWNHNTFSAIAQSEQAHMDSVARLLDIYGLAIPGDGTAGVFVNPTLQQLYASLTAQGSLSLADALKVGAGIEELDIVDLQTRLAQTDNADIQQVFASLISGSENHLRAFTRTLANQLGETYIPQYLSADAYAAIVAASSGNGNGGGAGGNGQGQRGRGGQGSHTP